MRVPCPACSILWRFDRFDACPICGREPPRGVRDPGPDDLEAVDVVADGGPGEFAGPVSTSAPIKRVELEADDLPVDEWVDVEKRPVVVQARRVERAKWTLFGEPVDLEERVVDDVQEENSLDRADGQRGQ